MTYPTPDNPNADRAETYRALQSHDRILSADWDADPTLDRAVVALRNHPVPEGPPDSLLKRTLASLNEVDPRELAASRNRLRIPIFLRPLLVAAGLLLVIGAIAMILLSSSSVAFADVARKVRESRSLIFTLPVPIPNPQNPDTTITVPGKLSVLEGDRLRMEIPDVVTMVFDLRNNRGIALDHKGKHAIVIHNLNPFPNQRNPNQADLVKTIQALKRLGGKPERELGEQQFDGRTLRGFVATQDLITFTVWADPRTGDPVRIEFAPPGEDGQKMTFADIQIDAPIDPADFNLAIPRGYEQFQLALPNVEGGEASLLNVLKGYTHRTNGRFPQRLTDWGDYVKVLQADAIKAALTGPRPQPGTLAGLSGEALEYVANLLAAPQFLSTLPKDSFGYLGANKSTGDSTQIIFWYKTPEGPHRAIFSDLTAREIKPEEIPRPN